MTEGTANLEASRARARAAFVAGGLVTEAPLRDGGRWGLAVVFRPADPVLSRLVSLADEASVVAGPGHWVHDAGALHLTVRSLEAHRSIVPDTDARLAVYKQALDEAAKGLPVVHMQLRGLNPHPGGVVLAAHPGEETVDLLRDRLRRALHPDKDGAIETWIRSTWYISLLHFAAPVPDPAGLLAWCDDRADLPVGTARFDLAEIVRWQWGKTSLRPILMHRTRLNSSDEVSNKAPGEGD